MYLGFNTDSLHGSDAVRRNTPLSCSRSLVRKGNIQGLRPIYAVALGMNTKFVSCFARPGVGTNPARPCSTRLSSRREFEPVTNNHDLRTGMYSPVQIKINMSDTLDMENLDQPNFSSMCYSLVCTARRGPSVLWWVTKIGSIASKQIKFKIALHTRFDALSTPIATDHACLPIVLRNLQSRLLPTTPIPLHHRQRRSFVLLHHCA